MQSFKDESVGVAEFKSTWKNARSGNTISTQTKPIKVDEQAAQTERLIEVETQTMEKARPDQTPTGAEGEGDPPGLLAYLKWVEPLVMKELDRTKQSTAFEGLSALHSSSKDGATEEATVLHTLANESLKGELSVTSLSWNATGSVIAASFGKFDHEGWCTHKACLCTWNLNKRVVSSVTPDLVADVSNCLMTVCFHPKKPAVIAGGNFNGEVSLWDVGREGDALVAASTVGDTDSHREPVSNVTWFSDPDSSDKQDLLMSTGYDGKMLIWSTGPSDGGPLRLQKAFILLADSMPRDMGGRSGLDTQEMGVSSLSFNSEDRSIFYIGSESGGIFKGSLRANNPPIRSVIGGDVPLSSPVSVSFVRHTGPVYSVDSSPFHRNIFLCCGSGTRLSIQSALQKEPVCLIEPASQGDLLSARWSLLRPLVIAVTTDTGSLLLYDLASSEGASDLSSAPPPPPLVLEASPKKKPVHALEFNQNQRQLLATGDEDGTIKVWQLGGVLTAEQPSERDVLGRLARASTE